MRLANLPSAVLRCGLHRLKGDSGFEPGLVADFNLPDQNPNSAAWANPSLRGTTSAT